jgi:hypothetical protein
MYKLALVQGPNVTIFEATGQNRKQHPDFATALASLLKDGWEPFGADSGNTVLVWFRIKV